MRRRSLVALCLALAPVIGLAQSPFRHAWRFEKNDTVLISTFTAPPPFSLSGEPEATLTVEASRLGVERPSLEAIVEREVRSIRHQTALARYAERDGKRPRRGIATWFERIAGQQVGFIKYRAAGGARGKRLPEPRTVIQAVAVKDDLAYFFLLTEIYAGHQAEVREDQLRMITVVLSGRRR